MPALAHRLGRNQVHTAIRHHEIQRVAQSLDHQGFLTANRATSARSTWVTPPAWRSTGTGCRKIHRRRAAVARDLRGPAPSAGIFQISSGPSRSPRSRSCGHRATIALQLVQRIVRQALHLAGCPVKDTGSLILPRGN